MAWPSSTSSLWFLGSEHRPAVQRNVDFARLRRQDLQRGANLPKTFFFFTADLPNNI
jgi:hypothetical protein